MTAYAHSELNLTDPRGYTHFVLYTEPDRGAAMGGLNATASIERMTRYAQEWRDRLERCEPNPLHTTLVGNHEIPKLFHPCVYEDKDSPSAIAGDGCTCSQTWMDLEFGLPVVARHFRTVTGNIERWTYRTYTPLDFRPRDTFGSLIIDGGLLFWARTADGVLTLLPQESGRGYGVGYGGGGPHELAQYIQKLIDTDGQDTAANASRYDDRVDPQILAWVSSKDADRTHELTLEDL